jgi:hypothetical protein
MCFNYLQSIIYNVSIYLFIYLFVYLLIAGDWTQGLAHARQAYSRNSLTVVPLSLLCWLIVFLTYFEESQGSVSHLFYVSVSLHWWLYPHPCFNYQQHPIYSFGLCLSPKLQSCASFFLLSINHGCLRGTSNSKYPKLDSWSSFSTTSIPALLSSLS